MKTYRILIFVLVGIFIWGIRWIEMYKPFGPYSALGEQLNTDMASKNFQRFGYVKLGFLENFEQPSKKINPSPFFYTHQPNLSTVNFSLLQSLGFNRERGIRVIYLIGFLLGIIFYYLVLKELFGEITANLCIVLLGLSFYNFLTWFDHPAYYLRLFFIFCPTYLLLPFFCNIKITFRKTRLMLVFAILMICALHDSFAMGSAISMILLLNYIIFNNALKSRICCFILLAPLSALISHFLRNIWILGFKVAFLDVYYTIFNRIGLTNTSDYVTFYEKHNIILNGRDMSITFMEFLWKLHQLVSFYDIPVLIGIYISVYYFFVKNKQDFKRIIFILMIFGFSSIWSLFVFFSHALDSLTLMLYIIKYFKISLYAIPISLFVESYNLKNKIYKPTLVYMAVCCLFLIVRPIQHEIVHEMIKKISHYPMGELKKLEKYKEKILWTNTGVNVSYFTDEISISGCSKEALIQKNVKLCTTRAQYSKVELLKLLSKPDYFFFSYNPAINYPNKVVLYKSKELQEFLKERFPVVESGYFYVENNINKWELYKL